MAIYKKESVVAASLELCECTKLYTLLVIVYRRQALSPLACARGLRFIQERRGAARSLWSPRRAVWSPRTAVWSPRRALWSPGRALWSLRTAVRSPRTARKYGMSGHLISPHPPPREFSLLRRDFGADGSPHGHIGLAQRRRYRRPGFWGRRFWLLLTPPKEGSPQCILYVAGLEKRPKMLGFTLGTTHPKIVMTVKLHRGAAGSSNPEGPVSPGRPTHI
jgi:hypothetical protein